VTTLDVMAEGRPASEVLTWSRGLVDPPLRSAVDELPSATRHIAGYHFGWWDAHGRPTRGNGGKAIRAALVLLSAAVVGGTVASALPAAVALELVHNHSLLHDDVIDADLARRHRPTAWRAFGVSSAILAGDALLALAFQVLAAGGHPAATDATRMLSAAVQDLLDGQCADVSFEHRSGVSPAECVHMAERKTAALLGCACRVGATLGGGNRAQVASLHSFGLHLGLAFQHVDDLLGIWGDPAVTGKPAYSDLRRHKKSLPVVAALASQTPAGRELADLYLRDSPLSGTDLAHAAGLIDTAGGRGWSRSQADELLARALAELPSASPAPQAAGELGALALLVTRRDY
jgi:geranylgeranyl diphosphate synthase type I